MILTKHEILRRRGSDIKINPWNDNNLNPNSYNLSLGDTLLVYDHVKHQADDEYAYHGDRPLDPKRDNPYHTFKIPEKGYVLYPKELYLAQTLEFTETHNLVPVISGRSSTGRLGICVHITAGFGDVGFTGHWTLEITVVRPVVVYPAMPLAQIYYHHILGDVEEYKGKYQHNAGVQPSMMFKDYETRR